MGRRGVQQQPCSWLLGGTEGGDQEPEETAQQQRSGVSSELCPGSVAFPVLCVGLKGAFCPDALKACLVPLRLCPTACCTFKKPRLWKPCCGLSWK